MKIVATITKNKDCETNHNLYRAPCADFCTLDMLHYKCQKEIKEMTKKKQKELNNRNRTLVLFNTGTRTHEDKRRTNRKKEKENIKKYLTFAE